MSTVGGPNIVDSGLILELDAGNIKSYQSGSTTWFDKSGNAYNGTLANGPTFNTGSLGSIVFDGVDDYISTPYTASIGTGGFTYSVWIRYTDSQLGTIISKRISTTYEQFSIFIAGDSNANTPGTKISVNDVQTVSLFRVMMSPNSYNDGLWHHVVSTRTSTSTLLYIDGYLVNSTTSSPIDLSVTSKLFLSVSGNNQTVAGSYFKGNTSLAQIYNRTLSSDEVLQNYNAQKSRFGL